MMISLKLIEVGEHSLQKIQGRCGKAKGAFLLNFLNSLLYFVTFIFVVNMKIPIGLAITLRGSFSCLILFFISYHKQTSLTIYGSDIIFVLKRSICIALLQIVLLWAAGKAPTSTVLTINSLGPIFVQLLNCIMHGNSISNKSKLYTIISFIGIYLIVNRQQGQKKQGALIASSILLFFVILWAYGIQQVNYISEKTTPIQISFYLSVILIVTGFTLTAYEGLQLSIFWPLPVIGILWSIAHNLFTIATVWAVDLGGVCMLMYIGVILGFLQQIFYRGEQINYQALLGSVLTVIGLAGIVFQ